MYGAFPLLISLDIKFMTILKKSNEIASTLNVIVCILNFTLYLHQVYLHFRKRFSVNYSNML